MARKVTLKEIAREVGLSPAAVSLVLNGRPCRISEESRRRIREVSRLRGYVPDQIARSLVTQRSSTVGLVVPNIESRLFSSLARNLELGCRRRGYALLITNSDDDPDNDAGLVRMLVQRGVDGLLLVASDDLAPSDRLVSDLSSSPVPFVLVDRSIAGLACDQVRFDGERGGYLATRRLVEAGHRRVGCIVNARSHTGRERLDGYLRALSEAGVEPRAEYVAGSTYHFEDAYEASARLVASDATAFFASSDNIALGLLRRLFERGVRVPADVSVVGYDSTLADTLFDPELTSVEQNAAELAEAALGLLFRRIDERAEGTWPGPAGEGFEELLLAPRLVERCSVAAPSAARDPRAGEAWGTGGAA